MSLALNHNLMANNVARNLNSHYAALGSSTRRLSSGLRVNSAADDAAGLAIRELQRAEIRTLQQGARNANDAISMIQTADGALSIIDEKLIRMKELAEQAATGTYDSTQRLMIDSEFQAMAAEIDRIANATEFNGIHLLNGALEGAHNGSGLNSTGALKIHFGTGNDSAEDYYYMNIGAADTVSLLFPELSGAWTGAERDGRRLALEVSARSAGNGSPHGIPGFPGTDSYQLPVGLKNVDIYSRNGVENYTHKPIVSLFTKAGRQLTGYNPDTAQGRTWWDSMSSGQVIAMGKDAGLFNADAAYSDAIINNAGQSVDVGGNTVSIVASQGTGGGVWEQIHADEITSDLVFMIGGHRIGGNNCYIYDLRITAEIDMSIDTQDKAQNMLTALDGGIARKDSMRARLGALQNRLENTVTNLSQQAESLQASESRISDVDVSMEMTDFVRNQILAQAAVAMLAQANSLPKMAMQVIGG